jgi:hypothetical protein
MNFDIRHHARRGAFLGNASRLGNYLHEPLSLWPRRTVFSQLPSVVASTVDRSLGYPSLVAVCCFLSLYEEARRDKRQRTSTAL